MIHSIIESWKKLLVYVNIERTKRSKRFFSAWATQARTIAHALRSAAYDVWENLVIFTDTTNSHIFSWSYFYVDTDCYIMNKNEFYTFYEVAVVGISKNH